jgi:hypothetical protein
MVIPKFRMKMNDLSVKSGFVSHLASLRTMGWEENPPKER